MPAAFIRREADPEKGKEAEKALSFDVQSRKSCHDSQRSCFGVAEIDDGEFESMQLTFTIDEHPHASLSGMPLRSEDITAAERCASLLAKASKLVLTPEYLSG